MEASGREEIQWGAGEAQWLTIGRKPKGGSLVARGKEETQEGGSSMAGVREDQRLAAGMKPEGGQGKLNN